MVETNYIIVGDRIPVKVMEQNVPQKICEYKKEQDEFIVDLAFA